MSYHWICLTPCPKALLPEQGIGSKVPGPSFNIEAVIEVVFMQSQVLPLFFFRTLFYGFDQCVWQDDCAIRQLAQHFSILFPGGRLDLHITGKLCKGLTIDVRFCMQNHDRTMFSMGLEVSRCVISLAMNKIRYHLQICIVQVAPNTQQQTEKISMRLKRC